MLKPEWTHGLMTFALFDDVSLIFVSYHAAVFVAVFAFLAIGWALMLVSGVVGCALYTVTR